MCGFKPDANVHVYILLTPGATRGSSTWERAYFPGTESVFKPELSQ